ncbi:Replication initiator protein A [Posidoniimonas corsicana]|uniref:Replication initiator protein A n=1 Tax=Posidoniimonas corsicana TaxID=1938618 RepID=A0A5C5VC25_9BACT|nr:replication initiator protein A [Posidoniimonas corsicana]TWT35185.1 Replication initiator protein A [Posidoniimonas corsicana]
MTDTLLDLSSDKLSPGDRSPLLPDRHPTADFFVCDVLDAAPKGDMASMEHPVFSLSSKPDRRVRRYEHGDCFVEVKPSSDGLATVHDRDILIYCISQLMAARNAGQPVSQVVRFKAYDLLTATNRMTNGQGYEALKAALERLSGTRISTNIVTGGQEIFETFGLIERAKIVRQTRDGRMQEIEVKLAEWVFAAIRHNEVLTLNKDYFRLRKPLERRLYECGRKFCGRQASWKISLELLHKKCGSTSTLKEFRRLITRITREHAVHQHIPDYDVWLDENDMVNFTNRLRRDERATEWDGRILLAAETYDAARRLAPGWDVYMIEQEWRAWLTDRPRRPDAAFLGFCRRWFAIRGAA